LRWNKYRATIRFVQKSVFNRLTQFKNNQFIINVRIQIRENITNTSQSEQHNSEIQTTKQYCMITLALQNSNMTSFVDYACIHNTMLKFPIYVTWLICNLGQIMEIIDELFPIFVKDRGSYQHENTLAWCFSIFPKQ
jgi:hypothetical protein